MKSLKFGAIAVIAMLTAACAAGINFVKPADDKLVLGTTTRAQIVTLMGEPNGKGQKVANGETLDVIYYAYASLGDQPVFTGVTPARSVGFVFHKDVLVGKEYTSSFKSDNTYFDPEKAKSIKQGMTKAQVVALLGNPGGEARHPVVANKNGKAIIYSFTQTKGFSSQQSVLSVELDERDVVQKADFNQAGQL